MDVTAERADIDAAVSGKTVCTIFADAAKNWADRPALHWKRDGEWRQLTWREYRRRGRRDDLGAPRTRLRTRPVRPDHGPQRARARDRRPGDRARRGVRRSASTTRSRPSRSSTSPTTRRRPSRSSRTRSSSSKILAIRASTPQPAAHRPGPRRARRMACCRGTTSWPRAVRRYERGSEGVRGHVATRSGPRTRSASSTRRGPPGRRRASRTRTTTSCGRWRRAAGGSSSRTTSLVSYLPLAHVVGAVHVAVERHLRRPRGVFLPGHEPACWPTSSRRGRPSSSACPGCGRS